jgi:hypothetical protein
MAMHFINCKTLFILDCSFSFALFFGMAFGLEFTICWFLFWLKRLGTVQELEDMKRRLKEMEEEAAALRDMQAKVEKEMGVVQGLHIPISIPFSFSL